MAGTNIELPGTRFIERPEEAEAAKSFRMAAEQGSVEAQYSLGVMYHEGGCCVPQDYAEAAKWFRKAAEQGSAEAQYSLGVMYYKGRGVPQDYAQAAEWFLEAAQQESAAAQSNLGVMYANGDGVPQDYVRAHMWFSLSAAREGGDRARRMREQIAEEMTAGQVAEAQRLLREWKLKK